MQLWMCIRWLRKFTSLPLLHCIPLTLKIGTEYIWFVRHITMRHLSTCSASSGVTVHKLLGVHDWIDVITSAAEFVYEGRIPLDVSHDGTLLCTCRPLSYLVLVRDLWLSAPPPKYHDNIVVIQHQNVMLASLLTSFVPRPLPQKWKEGSGVLSDISCHTGWGRTT